MEGAGAGFALESCDDGMGDPALAVETRKNNEASAKEERAL